MFLFSFQCRAVHRGSFFVEMRTTEARQLLPDAWGFICPVHTPDGSPCGLLNHLTIDCIVSDAPKKSLVDNVPRVLVDFGMIPLNSTKIDYKKHFVVLLEGRVIGHVRKTMAEQICTELRLLKIDGEKVPKLMEIVLVPEIKVWLNKFTVGSILWLERSVFILFQFCLFKKKSIFVNSFISNIFAGLLSCFVLHVFPCPLCNVQICDASYRHDIEILVRTHRTCAHCRQHGFSYVSLDRLCIDRICDKTHILMLYQE